MLGTKETHITVEYHELNKFVEQEFGLQKWNVAEEEETGNDVSLTFTVDGNVADYEMQYINDLKNGKRTMYVTNTILNYLAAEGKIEKGNYLINISW